MEYRKFGTTGLKTSLLGFGGFHLLEIPVSDAEKLLNTYLDAGGNYIETAHSYGNGESERKIARAVKHRRDDFILVSKIDARDKQGAVRELDAILHDLETDHLDILLMHAVGSMVELEKILSDSGACQAALEARKAGKIRFIGISMHGWPGTLIQALEHGGFDAVMMTANYYDRFNYPEIENKLLPLAQSKGAGSILMKPLADGFLYRSAEQAFHYAFSRPVSVVVTGINTQRMLNDDLQFAEQYTPMTQEEEQQLFRTAPELGTYICRQCGKCSCPEGINIPEVFACEGYYDRQMAHGSVDDTAQFALAERLRFWFENRTLAEQRYKELHPKADVCTECGKCIPMCPYSIDIPGKLHVADYKLAGRLLY
jgi:predicted aldo/keto reductase-like oxidoreductase